MIPFILFNLMHMTGKKKGTAAKKIISALLVLAAAIGVGLALATFLPQNRQPVAQPPEVLADTAIHSGRLPGYENAPPNTTPEYFWYLYNGSLGMGQDGSLPLLLENSPAAEKSIMRTSLYFFAQLESLLLGTMLPDFAAPPTAVRSQLLDLPPMSWIRPSRQFTCAVMPACSNFALAAAFASSSP